MSRNFSPTPVPNGQKVYTDFSSAVTLDRGVVRVIATPTTGAVVLTDQHGNTVTWATAELVGLGGNVVGEWKTIGATAAGTTVTKVIAQFYAETAEAVAGT